MFAAVGSACGAAPEVTPLLDVLARIGATVSMPEAQAS